jgi:hypothetical protein
MKDKRLKNVTKESMTASDHQDLELTDISLATSLMKSEEPKT